MELHNIKNIFHLENRNVVIIKVTAVHTQRCITTSTKPINSKYLKYYVWLLMSKKIDDVVITSAQLVVFVGTDKPRTIATIEQSDFLELATSF